MYQKELELYKEQGFVKIPKFFSSEDLQKSLEALKIFIASELDKLEERSVNKVQNQEINSIHKLALEGNYFHHLIHSERMLALAKIFLGEEAEPMSAEYFAKPAKVGLPVPPHQDAYYWNLTGPSLNVWIALDAANEENGIVTYFKGSQKQGLVPHKDSFAPGSSQMVEDPSALKKYEMVVEDLQAGDAFIHDALCIHSSTANRSERSRRAMTMQFKAKSAQVDLARKAEYEKKLFQQIEARKNAQTV